jgi:hypothetical protein
VFAYRKNASGKITCCFVNRPIHPGVVLLTRSGPRVLLGLRWPVGLAGPAADTLIGLDGFDVMFIGSSQRAVD